jgi:hypothetical protein
VCFDMSSNPERIILLDALILRTSLGIIPPQPFHHFSLRILTHFVVHVG